MRQKRQYKKKKKKRKKTTNRNRGSKSYCTSFRKRWRHYWSLMVKKYIWYINLKETRQRKKKKNKKHDKGFGDGF